MCDHDIDREERERVSPKEGFFFKKKYYISFMFFDYAFFFPSHNIFFSKKETYSSLNLVLDINEFESHSF
jgi:hypothetical protein